MTRNLITVSSSIVKILIKDEKQKKEETIVPGTKQRANLVFRSIVQKYLLMFSPRSNARYHCSVSSSIETEREEKKRRSDEDEEKRARRRETHKDETKKKTEDKTREERKKNVIFLMCNIISREGHRDDDPIVSPHRVHAFAFAFGRLRLQAQARSTWKAFVSSKRNTN